jgi:hypothetical protein
MRQKSALGLLSLNVFGYRRMRQYDSRRYGCPLVPNGLAGRNSQSERAQARAQARAQLMNAAASLSTVTTSCNSATVLPARRRH